jgi:hypothetical protein
MKPKVSPSKRGRDDDCANGDNLVVKQLVRSTSKEIVVLRPTTPEEAKKKCLGCANMEDFVKGL